MWNDPWWRSLLDLLFVAITYGKVSLWLWKSLKNSEFFLLLCGHPATALYCHPRPVLALLCLASGFVCTLWACCDVLQLLWRSSNVGDFCWRWAALQRYQHQGSSPARWWGLPPESATGKTVQLSQQSVQDHVLVLDGGELKTCLCVVWWHVVISNTEWPRKK